MKQQVHARRLAQLMVGIGRRVDKRVQALITDMNQPLGFAVGNALEVMEVSQTLQNSGPIDLTRLSLELAARMIHLAKITPTLEAARELAQTKLLDGSGYRKFKQVIAAQGGNAQVLDRFDLLPNATGMREIVTTRAGYVSAIDAEGVGKSVVMIGGGRNLATDPIDPAVGAILEVKVGQKVDAGSVLCRLYYTNENNLDEAAEILEGSFRISASAPDQRDILLEVVG
jgi:pyrimidine-nucleoside phosphorylase/thymidine phosphorylase